jgi:DNA primase
LPPSAALPAFNRPDPRDPVAAMERQALEVALQEPSMLAGETWQRFSEARFSTPAYLAIHEAIRATGLGFAGDPVRWVEQLLQEVPEPLRPLVSELSVVPLPANTADAVARYCRDILARLFELQITRVKADKMGQLQRLDASADPEEFQRLNRELMQLEMERRSLRSEG